MRTARFGIAAVLLLCLPGVGVALARACVGIARHQGLLLPLVVGALGGAALDHIMFRKIPGFETFEHELTHTLAALLFLRRVKEFHVTRYAGGHVVHQSGFGGQIGDEFIGLAPYAVPTFTVLSVLVRPFLPAGCFPWYDVWVGFTLGFHTWSTGRETRSSQSDIWKRGVVFSAIFILTVTVAVHGVLFAIALSGYSGAVEWGREVWLVTLAALTALMHFVSGLIQRAAAGTG